MTSWKGKDACVVGLGKSGAAAIRFLCGEGARVTLLDMKSEPELSESLAPLRSLSFEKNFGPFDGDRLCRADVLVLTPGVPRSLPPIQAALAAGVPVTNEPSLALERIAAPVIAVTGSAGKTTTCTLAAEMLRASGKRVFLGGNIGNPLLNLVQSGEGVDVVVAELSSFQIESLAPFRPAVTLFTPIGHDHLDRYPSADAYQETKRRLLSFGDRQTIAVLKAGNPVHEGFAQQAPGSLLWYGREPLPAGRAGAWFEQSTSRVHLPDGSALETSGKLGGMGNRENLASAACAALALGAHGEGLQNAVDGFGAMAHRMELVRELGGVRFFNDSKSTNVLSALSALGGFPRREVVLIAGGRNKAIDFTPLRDEVARACKVVVLVGEAKSALKQALAGSAPLLEAADFADAVRLAVSRAERGDSVVLSPACASHDLFRNYEERGETFRRLIADL